MRQIAFVHDDIKNDRAAAGGVYSPRELQRAIAPIGGVKGRRELGINRRGKLGIDRRGKLRIEARSELGVPTSRDVREYARRQEEYEEPDAGFHEGKVWMEMTLVASD